MNDRKLAPFEFRSWSPARFDPQDDTFNFGSLAPVTNSVLDVADKVTAYIVDERWKIPKDQGKIKALLAAIEEYVADKKWRGGVALGSAWTLKGVSAVVNGYNLYQLIAVALSDDLHVRGVDVASTISGLYSLTYDLMTEVEKVARGKGATARIFPAIIDAKAGDTWALEPAVIKSTLGKAFASLNVAAIIISGAATVYAMAEGMDEASKNGEFTSAAMYGVAGVGGVLQITGGLYLAAALVKAGTAMSAAVPLATLGVILITIGTLVAVIFAVLAKLFSHDEYEKYAFRCFLGTGPLVPEHFRDKLGLEKPEPIEKQYENLVNLLRRFVVFTQPLQKIELKKTYTDDLSIEITPGEFPPGSTTTVALHHGPDGVQTSVTLRWSPVPFGTDWTAKQIDTKEGKLLRANGSIGVGAIKDGSLHKMFIFLHDLSYEPSVKEILYTSVTVKFPDSSTTFRARKPVVDVGPSIENFFARNTDDVISGVVK